MIMVCFFLLFNAALVTVEFFRNNLVGVIMVFSLILWIPISCCISYKVS